VVLAFSLLRCKIWDRPGPVIQGFWLYSRTSEINDLRIWRVVGPDGEIPWLYIPVRDGIGVEEGNAFKDLSEKPSAGI
jgi:hypothetical protein